MRIAYITQSYPPMISGAAIAVEKLATAMAARGHEVLVIAASEKEQPYTVQHKNLTIVRLSSIHNPMRVNQRFLLFSHFTILATLRKFHPHIIHIHDPLHIAWPGITYAQRQCIPVTLTVHQIPAFVVGYLPDLPGLRAGVELLLWTYARWLMKQCDAVIAPSHTTSKLLFTETRIEIRTISNGIDLRTFHPLLQNDDTCATRQKWNLPKNVPLILHVGRLDTEKRVDRILFACARVLNKTTAHLFIVGDGREKENLIQLSHELGIKERVHFAGFVSPADGLSDIYRAANLFVTASESETQGIVLLEAAASGLPIVAPNVTCIPEIVHDHINGFLVNTPDIRAFSRALVELTTNPKMAKAMGRKARIFAEEHSITESWRQHEKIYSELSLRAREIGTAYQREKFDYWQSVKARLGLK